MRLFPRRYPPLPDGFRDYWIKIHVTISEGAYEHEPDEEPLSGYFRVLGLRCETGAYRRIVEEITDDGTVDWHNSEVQLKGPNSFSWSKRRSFHEIDENGFWFARGCIYYSAPTTDANEVP